MHTRKTHAVVKNPRGLKEIVRSPEVLTVLLRTYQGSYKGAMNPRSSYARVKNPRASYKVLKIPVEGAWLLRTSGPCRIVKNSRGFYGVVKNPGFLQGERISLL